MRIADHTGRSVGSTDTCTQFTHPSFEGGLDVRCIAACVAFDGHVRGNGIAYAVGDELGTRDDRCVARVDAPGHDGLERRDNLRTDNERINGHVRPGGVSADSRYVNDKVVFASHYAPHPGGEIAGWHARHIVNAIDAIDREARQDIVGDHGMGTVAVFFVGLEDKAHGARPAFVSGQLGGCTE